MIISQDKKEVIWFNHTKLCSLVHEKNKNKQVKLEQYSLIHLKNIKIYVEQTQKFIWDTYI